MARFRRRTRRRRICVSSRAMDGLFPLFPVFVDLAGRPVVLLGGDAALAGLAPLLLASGAGVSAIDPAPGAEMRASGVRIVTRRWRQTDLRGAALVIAGANERRAAKARLAARGAQAMFHQLGEDRASDVALGAALARGSLALGVMAQGAPLALAEALRARLEAALPAGVAEFMAAASAARPRVEAVIAEPAARDAFWTALAQAAFAGPQADWRAFIDAALRARTGFIPRA